MTEHNIILLTDSYKVSHHLQYPPKTSYCYSYFESRGGKFKNVIFFGLQYIVKKYLTGVQVTEEKIQEAKEILSEHLGSVPFNEAGWRYILENHGGKLPVIIKAVPEGTTVPVKNVLFTVENTDPECYWLVGYLETILLQCWYPSTVASYSHEMKKVIHQALKATSGNFGELDFQLHDFGFRGTSSIESAGLGACAHLVNFKGTDTIAGLTTAKKYYSSKCAGFSVPASEHSTTTVWGPNNEREAFQNMLTVFDEGIVSVVSDSYDIYHACRTIWGEQLKEDIIKRGEKGGRLVVRPDSGDPATVVLQLLEIFEQKFGTKKNAMGFKVLPRFIRILQGDGINLESVAHIFEHLKQNGWSAENVVLGCGGSLLQKHNRDTQKFAFKCSFAVVDGKGIEVYKDPITDKVKKSKRGKMALVKNGDEKLDFETIQHAQTMNGDIEAKDVLVPVFQDGEILVDYTLDSIRERVRCTFDY